MKSVFFVCVITIFICFINVYGGVENESVSIQSAQEDKSPKEPQSILNQSEEISGVLSKTIGIAISPILGMGALGAYGYFTTPVEERAHLPWYNSPKFWIPLLVILLFVISKDFLATLLPFLHPFKKPFDGLANFGNIISAVISMPIVLSFLTNMNSDIVATLFLENADMQLIQAGMTLGIESTLFIVVGVIGFILV